MTSFQIGGLVSSWYSGGWNWWDVAQDGLFMPLVVILYVLFGFLSGQSESPTPFPWQEKLGTLFFLCCFLRLSIQCNDEMHSFSSTCRMLIPSFSTSVTFLHSLLSCCLSLTNFRISYCLLDMYWVGEFFLYCLVPHSKSLCAIVINDVPILF